MRGLTEGRKNIDVGGTTLGEVIGTLEHMYPGVTDRLNRDPTLAVSVDGRIMQKILPSAEVREHSEIHFIPSISGG